MKYTDVPYSSVPNDDECFVTGVQIGKIIDEPASTIREWAKTYRDFLYIKKINGNFKYTEKSIEQFKEIKEWRREKGYPSDVIKDILSKRGQGFGEYDGGLIDPKDPLGFDVLSGKIMKRNEEMLKDFSKALIEHISKRDEMMISQVKEETSITVQEVLETYIPKISDGMVNTIKDELATTKDEIIKLREENEKARLENQSLRSENEELLTREINKLKAKVNRQSEEIDNKEKELKAKDKELSEEKNKSVWKRIFNK